MTESPWHVLVVVLAWSAALGSQSASAPAQLLGPEFRVNTYTTYNQTYSAAASDGAGGFVVVWNSEGQDGPHLSVFGRRFDAADTPASDEFPVSTSTSVPQVTRSVASNPEGGFVVVWEALGEGLAVDFVVGQAFDSYGAPLGSQFEVDSYAGGSFFRPRVAAIGPGSFVVTWHALGSSGNDVFARLYDGSGNPIGSRFLVNTYTEADEDYPAVAPDGEGGFVVVWEGHRGAAGLSVFGQRFDASGSPVGVEFPLGSSTSEPQGRPEIVRESSGGFFVVWESEGVAAPALGLVGRRFDDSANPLSSEFQVNTHTTGLQARPVAAAATDGVVVVWHSENQDGSGDGVYAQRFDREGNRVGSEFRVNAFTTSSQFFPGVASDPSGDFLVTWDSVGQDGSLYGVYARRLRVAVFAGDFESGDVCDWSATMGGGSCT